MRKRLWRAPAALLIALLMAALTPALTEAQDIGASGAPAMAADPVSENVDPEAALAWDAGDTGLTVEYEETPAEAAFPGEFAPDEEMALSWDGVAPDEGAETVAAADGAADSAPAEPRARVGYAAVAPEAPVYSDPDLSLIVGSFPEGAAVYAEAVERDGALLRIRFDTEDARRWAQDIPAGYVRADDALCYTEAEAAALVQIIASDPRTRRLDDAPIPCVRYETQDYAVMAGLEVKGLGVAAHTPEEIQAFVNAWPAYRNQVNLYAVAGTDAPYTVGALSAVNQRSALNMINQVRFIAGLNAGVTPLPEQEYPMAAASLVLRLNGGLSHYPARPAALADPAYDALYWTGYAGAGHANIAMGYTTTGAILAYMADADDGNISTVGHRRWILNPRLSRTIFGANGRFSAMYAHDLSGEEAQTRVAWPAQQMPLQYFSASDPWSVSFGRALDPAQVRVDLARARDSRQWHFSQARSDGYFNVENSLYGQPGCVVFRPAGLEGLAEGDLFHVSITDGASGEITCYTVNFFNLDLSAANPMETLSVTAVKYPGANAVNWNALPWATGYYVCRRTEATGFQIIADINDNGYLDADVSDDQTYYYQVYAHNDSVTSRSAASVQASPIPPEAVVLDAAGTVTLYGGATLQLRAGFIPANAGAALTWRSSRERVASVDANGLVTPLKRGTTVVSVETDNGKRASVKVKVAAVPKPKKVILSASGTVVMVPGETLRLAAAVQPAEAPAAITWSTSKGSVAQVTDGLVAALGQGKATITARAVNGKRAKLKIRVVDPLVPDSVALNQSGRITLRVGQSLKLEARVAPATARTELSWSSSREKVAIVDADGTITALRRGSATVRVRTSNGKTAKVRLKVVE